MSSKRGHRGLNAHEQALWEKVVENTRPLKKPAALGIDQSAPKPETPDRHTERTDTRLPNDFRVGRQAEASPHPKTVLGPVLPGSSDPPRMDRKLHTRMKRGRISPEARLDLHGMTLAAAHPVLTRFILSAQVQGKRLVLVITGKGKHRDDGGPIPTRLGALRQEVPMWLRSGALAAAVLDIAPAHSKHGGSGAYYVYLRRSR